MSQTESTADYSALLKRCDELIRAGKFSSVTALLSGLTLAQVPRTHRQSLAKVCRRAGLISMGLRLLHPVIHSDKPLLDPATAGEICEYAVLLSRIGSISEALELLSKVSPVEAPEALLYQGFCHISMWEYKTANGYLEQYLAQPLEPYAKLVSSVNLASGYLMTKQFDAAETLLNSCIETATSLNSQRLVGNCLELRGRMQILRGDFAKARLDLDRASGIFGQAQSYDQLLIAKWHALMAATEHGSASPLLEFRKEAFQRQHWESVRDADLFSLKIEFDSARFDYLYYGTPLAAYRARIGEEVAHTPNPEFIFGESTGRCVDLATGELDGGEALQGGRMVHKVIGALIRDFYVPRNIGSLFSELYPGEYFDIASSPLRVRQLLSRTRKWASENQVPLTIEQNKGSYRLSLGEGFGIRMSMAAAPLEPSQAQWSKLKNVFPIGREFKIQEACERLGCSKSGFHRLSAWAIENGSLLRTGEGKATRYRRAG